MMMAWSQNHDMFKGFNKWHILGAFCFVFFVCRFLKRGQNDDQCLFCIVFWVQNCVSFYYANCFFCQLPSKKFMSRSDKKGFFVCFLFNWKWEVMPTFLFCFYLFDYLEVNWFLLDWRLQDYYGNFGKGVQSSRTAVLSQIVFLNE